VQHYGFNFKVLIDTLGPKYFDEVIFDETRLVRVVIIYNNNIWEKSLIINPIYYDNIIRVWTKIKNITNKIISVFVKKQKIISKNIIVEVKINKE